MQDETSAAGKCAIAVMAKASVPGLTKTRLCPPLTAHDAADLNTAFLLDITANLLRAGEEALIHPWMAYTPARSENFFRSLLGPSVGLVACEHQNFGVCLHQAVTSLLAQGHASACVLNSDSPTLPSAYLVAAATILATPGDRMVIGPSTDGGYYLLGLKAPHRRVFEDIAWSTDAVFRTSLERAREIGLETVILPEWYDVDDASTLERLAVDVLDAPSREASPRAPACDATRGVLQRLVAEKTLRRENAVVREVA